jgi:hypothetical protein
MDEKIKKIILDSLEEKLKSREIEKQEKLKKEREATDRRRQLLNSVLEVYQEPVVQKYLEYYLKKIVIYNFHQHFLRTGPYLVFEKEGIFIEQIGEKKKLSDGTITFTKYNGKGPPKEFSYDLGRMVKNEDEFRMKLYKNLYKILVKEIK